jgi:hypothetical protein
LAEEAPLHTTRSICAKGTGPFTSLERSTLFFLLLWLIIFLWWLDRLHVCGTLLLDERVDSPAIRIIIASLLIRHQ